VTRIFDLKIAGWSGGHLADSRAARNRQFRLADPLR